MPGKLRQAGVVVARGRARVRCLIAGEPGSAMAQARSDRRASPWSNGPPDYAHAVALRPGRARAAPLAARAIWGPAAQRFKPVGVTTSEGPGTGSFAGSLLYDFECIEHGTPESLLGREDVHTSAFRRCEHGQC